METPASRLSHVAFVRGVDVAVRSFSDTGAAQALSDGYEPAGVEERAGLAVLLMIPIKSIVLVGISVSLRDHQEGGRPCRYPLTDFTSTSAGPPAACVGDLTGAGPAPHVIAPGSRFSLAGVPCRIYLQEKLCPPYHPHDHARCTSRPSP